MTYKSGTYVPQSPRTQETDLEKSLCPHMAHFYMPQLLIRKCLLLISLYDVQSTCTFKEGIQLAKKQHHLAAIKAPSRRLKKNTISN